MRSRLLATHLFIAWQGLMLGLALAWLAIHYGVVRP